MKPVNNRSLERLIHKFYSVFNFNVGGVNINFQVQSGDHHESNKLLNLSGFILVLRLEVLFNSCISSWFLTPAYFFLRFSALAILRNGGFPRNELEIVVKQAIFKHVRPSHYSYFQLKH